MSTEIGCHSICHDCKHLRYNEVYVPENDDYGWEHNCLKNVENKDVQNCPLFEFNKEE